MSPRIPASLVLSGGLLAGLLTCGCATTVHDQAPPPETWRADPSEGRLALAPGEKIPAYVAAFGLAPSVAERWPELIEKRVGFGVAQRVADALWGLGRFTFYEEKAEMAARLAEILERRRAVEGSAGDEVSPEVPWLLYGEVVDVQVEVREQVAGFAAHSQEITRVTVQLRLVERASGRFQPATGTGAATSDALPRRSDTAGRLDPAAVSEATGAAVRLAAGALAERLGGAR